MTTFEKNTKDIADEIYKNNVHQILIDLVQEEVEGLFSPEDDLRSDTVGSVAYQCENLLTVYSPEFTTDISILKRLCEALNAWQNDLESTNKILGLPPCA